MGFGAAVAERAVAAIRVQTRIESGIANREKVERTQHLMYSDGTGKLAAIGFCNRRIFRWSSRGFLRLARHAKLP